MAAFKHLLSQTNRPCFSNAPPPRHLVSLLRRHFSAEPQPSPNPEPSNEPNTNSRRPVPIQPVSYPAKPRPPPPEETQQESPPEKQTSAVDTLDPVNAETWSWTRDEMRYMKDTPVISPVSYPSRVAPLPEDRVRVGEEEKRDRNEELERERRRIEEDRRRGVLRYRKEEEVEENLPFPRLIKVENADQNNKKKGKMIYDLKEAIRLVKFYVPTIQFTVVSLANQLMER
ncbi:hypothetical protein Sango_2469900 [Sesamum angolense]|uniref:Uncharacterized protein n=1 Tax=Sesamum angolense TaxID=2727404 RepID=A0AAE1W3H1_9LAMI|nr:hypothetical protein Sango_2469900 [Sesamum angolense]